MRQEAKKNKKVAFVGLGWASREIWLQRFDRHAGFEVVGGFDPEPTANDRVREKFISLKLFSSIEELITERPDLVVVAVPNVLHVEMAELFLRNNISVLLEKPLCLDTKEYLRLKEAVTSCGAMLLSSKATRLRFDVRELAGVVNSGIIGKVLSMDLKWLRRNGIPKLGGWFTNKSLAGGGVGYDLGWHVLDVGLEILGYPQIESASGVPIYNYGGVEEGCKVKARWRQESLEVSSMVCDVETQMIGLLRTAEGIAINLNVAWTANIEKDTTLIVLHGENGDVELVTTFGFSPCRIKKPTLSLCQNGETCQLDLPAIAIGREYDAQVEWVYSCLCGEGGGDNIDKIGCVVNALDMLYASIE